MDGTPFYREEGSGALPLKSLKTREGLNVGMIFVRDPSVLALDGIPLNREEDPVAFPPKKSSNGVGRGLSNMGIIYQKGFGVYWDLPINDSGALLMNMIKI